MKYSLYLLTLILFSLTFLPATLAEININTYSTSTDFSVFLPINIDVCACGSTTDTIMLQNTGSYDSKFYIVSSEPDLLLVANEFTISSGDYLNIPFTVVADCDFNNKPVTITITNLFNVQKEYELDIIGVSCQNLAAKLQFDTETVKPCEAINYNLLVENIGTFTDTYSYDFGEYSKYAYSNYSSVQLLPNNYGQFSIDLVIPCEFYGNYTIPINVYTEGSGFEVNFATEINILQDYPFSTNLESQLFACAENKNKYGFILKNEANFENTFYIKSLNSEFIDVVSDKVSIPANSETIVEFEITGLMKKIGTHNIEFEISTELGDMVEVINSSLDMAECYNLEINSDQDYYDLCGRDINDIEFVVKNKGAINQNIWLELPNWGGTFSLDNSSLHLESNTETIVNFDFTNLLDKDKTYKVPVIAHVDGSDKTFSKTFIFDVQSSYNCHRAVLSPRSVRINYDVNQTEHFLIKNIGVKSLIYNVTIIPQEDNYPWIEVSTKSFLVPLNPYEEKIINITFEQGIFYSDAGDYLFNVTIEPLNSFDDLSYDQVFKVKLRDKSFLYYTGVWISSNPVIFSMIILILLLLLLLLYLLFSRPKNIKAKKKRKNKFKLILWLFILLMALLLIGLLIFSPFKSIYPKINENDDALNVAVYSGNTVEIDLSSYFEDPDNDTLEYYVKLQTVGNQSVANFSINFENSIAFVNTVDNTSGILPMWFYATDSVYLVKSELFVLTVVEKPIFTLYDYVEFYFLYLLWLGLLIFLGIYVFALGVWAGKRTKRQHETDKKQRK